MAFERIKKINGNKYRYLVESARIKGKVKQKVIKYLGKVGEGTDTDNLASSKSKADKNVSSGADEFKTARVLPNGMASISRKLAGKDIEWRVRN